MFCTPGAPLRSEDSGPCAGQSESSVCVGTTSSMKHFRQADPYALLTPGGGGIRRFFFNAMIRQKIPDGDNTYAFPFLTKPLHTLLDRRARMFDSIDKDEDRLNIGR